MPAHKIFLIMPEDIVIHADSFQADTGIVDQERKTLLGQETQNFFQVQPLPGVGAPSTHVSLGISGKWRADWK